MERSAWWPVEDNYGNAIVDNNLKMIALKAAVKGMTIKEILLFCENNSVSDVCSTIQPDFWLINLIPRNVWELWNNEEYKDAINKNYPWLIFIHKNKLLKYVKDKEEVQKLKIFDATVPTTIIDSILN